MRRSTVLSLPLQLVFPALRVPKLLDLGVSGSHSSLQCTDVNYSRKKFVVHASGG
jgi:hypothetical protein